MSNLSNLSTGEEQAYITRKAMLATIEKLCSQIDAIELDDHTNIYNKLQLSDAMVNVSRAYEDVFGR